MKETETNDERAGAETETETEREYLRRTKNRTCMVERKKNNMNLN